MRIFRMTEQGKFVEYKEQDFKVEHREAVLESWLELNPAAILEDGELLFIGRQVATNLRTFIDLLALDRDGNLVVVELKRGRTPRDTLAQALEYASFAANLSHEQLEEMLQSYLDDENVRLSEYHHAYFDLDKEESVSLNKEQGIVIVGEDITPEIRQTAKYLRQKGLPVTCLEFKYFETELNQRMLSVDMVVGMEPIPGRHVSTGSLPKTDKTTFLNAADAIGRPIFETILATSERYDLPIHWGSKGFSLNADIDGDHIALCFCYPPNSAYQQSIYTGFRQIEKKIEGSDEIIEDYRQRLQGTGLFVPAGSERELKCMIDQPLTDEQVSHLNELLIGLAKRVITSAEEQ